MTQVLGHRVIIDDLKTKHVHTHVTPPGSHMAVPPQPPPLHDMSPEHTHSQKPHPAGVLGVVWEILKFSVIALLIVLPVRYFIAQPFVVSGTSMVPTFNASDYLVIDEVTYRFYEPQRGDVIIFRYPLDPSTFFVKRVIGLPYETVEVSDGTITIVSADKAERFVLKEPYVVASENTHRWSETVTLGAGEYYVLGDNRDVSADSRVWGPLPERYIMGRAFAQLMPITQIQLFPGKYEF